MLELALCSANSEHHKGMGSKSTLHPGLVGHRKGTKRVSGQGAAILSRELITGVEGNPCFVPWPLVLKALDLTNAVHTLSCIKFHAHFITQSQDSADVYWSYKNCGLAWSCMAFIWAFWKQRQADLWVWGQPDLHRVPYQQRCTVRTCPKKEKERKGKKRGNTLNVTANVWVCLVAAIVSYIENSWLCS